MTVLERNLPLKRIEALSDGIFAIAMTILVLNIGIPDKETVQKIGLHNALLNQQQEFYSYFLSFFLLGIFWIIQHKQMNLLIKTNNTHIWITILLLMFICLIPFSASLQSDYGNDYIASAIFCGNMMIIGFIFLLSWIYTMRHKNLIPGDLSKERITAGSWNIGIFICISTSAFILSFFMPSYSGLVFLLIPVLKLLNKKNAPAV